MKRITTENKLKNYFRLNQYNLHKIKSNMHKNSTSNETVVGIA